MVKVRGEVNRLGDGRIDLDGWIARLSDRHSHLDADAICRASALVRGLGDRGEAFLESGMELAELAGELRLDTTSVVAALAYRPVRAELLTLVQVGEAVGGDAAHLLEEVLRMASSSLLEMSNTRLQTSERRDQANNVRRMLIAMIDDARVAVLKLAERVVALRAAKHDDEARKQRIAREAHLVFAPLASRLGIWQLKWELEDLALRYLAPDIYMAIARQLDGRREEREAQIAEMAQRLQTQLRERHIDAVVHGRAKHIYSIWRKMRAKNIGISEVYDVRAVRIVVPDIAQCYAALGVIHTQWQHVPSEFDDYIAVPKDNGYRSIHTAVMGQDGRTLEVQIRTTEMHEQAELGVCAHWSYKDGGAEDRPYAEKMNWLRQVVEWRDDVERNAVQDIGDDLRELFRDERIFVSTPRGHVLDLAAGSTPVDFAYRVHTEIGHRCRAALVEGQLRALNRPLHTGERVEIQTGESAEPQRYWLDAHLGYTTSGRAREKIHDWFRSRDAAVNEAQGRARLLHLLDSLGLGAPADARWWEAARRLGFADPDAVCRAVGGGDCQPLEALDALHPQDEFELQMELLPGVGAADNRVYRIAMEADDRDGLLRDVTQLLSELSVSLIGNEGRVDPATERAHLKLDVRVSTLRELAVVVERLQHLPDVFAARVAPGTVHY
ncbi:MAG: HD domain-containing protein [Gammaproteobacteria bacterium]|nr:HD domain-containing protein [Gammaproteobacteria bacterium]